MRLCKTAFSKVKSYKICAVFAYIFFSLSALFISIECRAFDIYFYCRQFSNNNTEYVTGKRFDELVNIAWNLIKFLITGSKSLLVGIFSEKEILHMRDVYNLFLSMYIFQFILAILLVWIFLVQIKTKNFKSFCLRFRNIIFCNYILVIIGGIFYTFFGFTKIFIQFHHLFFSNNLWILDPETDLMIQMLPENFFSTMALEILGLWIILNVIAQIILTFVSHLSYKFEK